MDIMEWERHLLSEKEGIEISSGPKQQLGRAGEDFAVRYLEKAGLKILERNYRCPKGEMDIIAQDGPVTVFIEVRTRSSGFRGWGEETITRRKYSRMQGTATYYLKEKGYKEWPLLRFDALALRWMKGEEDHSPEIVWLKGIS